MQMIRLYPMISMLLLPGPLCTILYCLLQLFPGYLLSFDLFGSFRKQEMRFVVSFVEKQFLFYIIGSHIGYRIFIFRLLVKNIL